MKIIFVGGVFLEEQREAIEAHAKGNVQYAADALQKSLLKGISRIADVETHLINVPFISSFPRGDRQPWFPGIRTTLFDRISVVGKSFTNILVLRTIDRFRAAYAGLREVIGCGDSATIVVYSAHAPFLLAALLFGAGRTAVTTCLILPDFPEFMGDGGLKYKIISKINSALFHRLAPHFDFFVVLTPQMAEKLRLDKDRFAVIEGIYDPSSENSNPDWSKEPGTVFIYTGTLAARYGILDLLLAFSELKSPDVRLWICGDGDAKQSVIAAAEKDSRILFHGLVSRTKALQLQSRAHVMVNPRRPDDEYTQYSFPSKTMEYLASGRPTVMHWLPGIPEEYRPFLLIPDRGDAHGLATMMAQVLNTDVRELERLGQRGRDFVISRKGPHSQAAQIIELLRRGDQSK